MTRKSSSWLWNPHPLVPAAFPLAGLTLVAAWPYLFSDSLWGRPIPDEVVMALYLSVSVGPGLAWILGSWMFRTPSEATASLPKVELLVGRTLIVAFCLAPLLWALITLVAWYEEKPALPVEAVYLYGGAQALAYVLFLAAAVVFSRRRRAALSDTLSGITS